MRRSTLSLMALSLSLLVAPAFADVIPYPNAGHVAPTTSVTATGNTLDIYFYGSSAADTDKIKVQDVTQGWTSGLILDNHSTAFGQEFSFSVNPGDVLVFYLVNQTTGQTYSSDPAGSADGYNHAYITAFSGSGGIPAGTFVGFEDLYIGANRDGVCGGAGNQSDCDYNDDEFIFVGVDPAPAPEPSSLALLGTSILGAAGMMRRRFVRR
jgi:hypothetical protein